MNRIDVLVPRLRKTPHGFRFNLRGLLLIVTVASIVLGLWLRPRPYSVEVLLHLDPGITDKSLHSEKYEEMIQSHLRLVESDKVLLAAIRDPAVASLSVLETQDKPLSWIRAMLEVTRQEQQLLLLRMHCTQSDISTCSTILEAVVNSYEAEVVAMQSNASRDGMSVRLLGSQLHHEARAKQRLSADGQSTQAIAAEIEDLKRTISDRSQNRDLLLRVRRAVPITVRQN